MKWFKKSCPVRDESPSRLKKFFGISKLQEMRKRTLSEKSIGQSEIQKLPQTLDNINLVLDEEQGCDYGECSHSFIECAAAVDTNNNVDVDDGDWFKKWYLPTVEREAKKRKFEEEEIELAELPPTATTPNTTFWPIVVDESDCKNDKTCASIKNPSATVHHNVSNKKIMTNNRSSRRVAHKILLPPTNDKGNSSNDNRTTVTSTKTTTNDDNSKISQYFGLNDYGNICIHHDIDIVNGKEVKDCPFESLMWRLWKIKEVTDKFSYNENALKKICRALFGNQRHKKWEKYLKNGGAFYCDESDDENGGNYYCFISRIFFLVQQKKV